MDSNPSRADTSPGQPPVKAARFSLERLSSAFARLMGATSATGQAADARPQLLIEPADAESPADDALPVTPRMIVEGMLFVGSADGRALTAHELSSHIRDVGPLDVPAIVTELNAAYARDESALEIVEKKGAYRLQLRSDLTRVRDRIRGRVRVGKLTPAAIEVLSVVAYRQGASSEEVSKLRGSQSHAILAHLLQRQLVRVERPSTFPRRAHYYTTPRFNELFGLASPAELPQADELVDG